MSAKKKRPSVNNIKAKPHHGLEDTIVHEIAVHERERKLDRRDSHDSLGSPQRHHSHGSHRIHNAMGEELTFDSHHRRGDEHSTFPSRRHSRAGEPFSYNSAQQIDEMTLKPPLSEGPSISRGRRPSQIKPVVDIKALNRQKKKAKRDKKKPFVTDPTEVAFGSIIIFMAGFMFIVLLLLVIFSSHYIVDTVGSTREWYALHGSTMWAKSQATSTLRAAEEVWRALHALDLYGLAEASRYRKVEQALAPVFMAYWHIRSVELDYSYAEQSGLVVHVGRASTDYNQLEIQTNAADCFLLGVESCLLEVVPFVEDISDLQVGESRWDPEARLRLFQPVSVGESSSDSPVLMGAEAWLLCLRMNFLLPYGDSARSGSDMSVGIAGRVTIEVKDLFSDGLVDERLGKDGLIFLCSENGDILATQDLHQILLVNESESSVVYPRQIWTLPTVWASELESVFGRGIGDIPYSGKLLETDIAKDVTIAVRRLDGAFDSFVVVVVAPDWAEFATDALLATSYVSIGWVSLLLSIGCIASMVLVCRKAPKQAMKQRVNIALKRSNSWRRSVGTNVSVAVSAARARFSRHRKDDSSRQTSVTSRRSSNARHGSSKGTAGASDQLSVWRPTVINDDPPLSAG
mmetsp:Transcript_1578/g.4058  ORF Transcript_1578/g.4058 Transcript_1578/m.4058 type:complete len:631 (+) Transcript_1578:116-2008(+)